MNISISQRPKAIINVRYRAKYEYEYERIPTLDYEEAGSLMDGDHGKALASFSRKPRCNLN